MGNTTIKEKRNPRFTLTEQQERTYLKMLADAGTPKQPTERRRYRMTREMYSQVKADGFKVLDGLTIKGRSTLVDSNGDTVLQWIKTTRDHERLEEMLVAALDGLKSDIEPTKPVKLKSTSHAPNLCNQYTITDYHLGMMAWGEETGADWDLAIAEKLLIDWFGAAIAQSPKAETAVLAQLGDFLHWDGMDAVTPASKHVLDADTRFSKLVRTAVRVLRKVINMMLEKYPKVHIVMAEGNHDLASSVWLREMFSAFYENEDRLTVDTNPDPYYCYEHGQTMLFYHHGHKKKFGQIASTFVSKFKHQYGRSKNCYAHTGHLHFDKIETGLMTLEQHQTLAAKDAYASRGGWNSGRSASVITYHKQHGEVGRIRLSPDMFN